MTRVCCLRLSGPLAARRNAINSSTAAGHWNQISWRPLNTLIANRKMVIAISTRLTRGSRMNHPQARAKAGRGAVSEAPGLPARLGRRRLGLRRRAALNDAVARHRMGDVLQALFAEAFEADRELVAHLFVDRAGDENAARLGQFLQSRRDIDAVAIDVVALQHHVAQIDADAKIHPLRFGQFARCGWRVPAASRSRIARLRRRWKIRR